MCSKQKIRKTALILLLVALFSLIPSNTFRVLADGDIVPPFPYDELQTIGENDYVLFKVHGVEQVDYIECLMPRINAHGNFQHLCPGLSYSSLGGWVLQINSIDYYFKDGQSVYFDLQSLFTTSFMPVENDDNYFPAWLEFVYTTEEIWGIDEDSNQGRGLKWFKDQNFIIPPAATPTPTPIPEDDEPSSPIPDNDLIDGSNLLFLFKVIDENNIYYNQYIGMQPNNMSSWLSSGGKIYLPYFKNTDGGVTCTINNAIFFSKIRGDNPLYYFNRYGVNLPTSDSLETYLDRVSFNTMLNASWGWSSGGQAFGLENGSSSLLGGVSSQSLFEIVAFNHDYNDNLVINYDSSITPSPTPTPTTAPTPIPQPSTTPEPEDPDKNSSWGWGIVNTLRYIFIPDKNKLIRLQKTADTKFKQFGGGYDDLKRVSGFEDPVRPQNVVMNWQPFGTDSPEQQQQITLVDFEQIDFYLFQTSSGMFIKDCLSASFTFLMFGYLIHVIRKHFVIENTDDDEKGGGD